MPSSSAAWSVTSPIVPAPITTALSTPDGRQPHGVDAVGQRLHQRADARGDAVGQPPRVGRGHLDEVGERARDVDADQHAIGAEVGMPGAAQAALAAAAQGVDGDPRALELRRALAGGDDHARELVAHDQRRDPVAHVAEVALDLRAADPHRLGAQDQLARAGIAGLRLLLDRHLGRPLPHDRLHTTSTVFTSSPNPVIAIRTSSPPRSVNSTAGITDVPVSSTAPTGKSCALNSH